MLQPFGSQAQRSIAPGFKQEPPIAKLTEQLLLAKKAKDSGDKVKHAAELAKFDYMLKAQDLEHKRASLEQAQKSDAKIRELVSQENSREFAQGLIQQYLDLMESGKTKEAVGLLAIIKDANPQIAAMLEARGNPLHESAQHGVSDDVQGNIYFDMNKEALNAESIPERIRRKEVTGQDLLESEKILRTNELGGDVDPTAAGRVRAGLQADANTTAQIESDEKIAETRAVPKEQRLSKYVMQNYEDLGFTKAEAFQLNNQILKGGVDELDFIKHIHMMQQPEDKSDSEWLNQKNQWIAEILGASGPGAGRTTDTAELERMIRRYPKAGVISDSMHSLSSSRGPTQARDLMVHLDHLAGGIGWDDQPEPIKDKIVERAKREIDKDPPGGEAGVRVLAARKELITELPAILEKMRAYERKYGAGSLNNALRWQDKVVRIATTASSNPELEEIRTLIHNMTSNSLLFKSGAAVTEQEYGREIQVQPAIGVDLDFSLARAEAALSAGARGLTTYYTEALGPVIGGRIIEKYVTPAVKKVQTMRSEEIFYKGVNNKDRQWLENATGTDRTFIDDARANNYSAKQILEDIRKNQ